jgi:hypothetical protein
MSEQPIPAAGAAAHALSDAGKDKLGGASITGVTLKTIDVKIDGSQALFMQYDESEVSVTIDLSVGFKELDAAASDATFSIGTELFAVEPRPGRHGKPKPVKPVLSTSPSGPGKG